MSNQKRVFSGIYLELLKFEFSSLYCTTLFTKKSPKVFRSEHRKIFTENISKRKLQIFHYHVCHQQNLVSRYSVFTKKSTILFHKRSATISTKMSRLGFLLKFSSARNVAKFCTALPLLGFPLKKIQHFSLLGFALNRSTAMSLLSFASHKRSPDFY